MEMDLCRGICTGGDVWLAGCATDLAWSLELLPKTNRNLVTGQKDAWVLGCLGAWFLMMLPSLAGEGKRKDKGNKWVVALIHMHKAGQS